MNVVFNYLAIPRYGIHGAAWSSVAAWFAAVVLLPAAFSATRPFVGVFLRPTFPAIRELADANKG